VLSPDVALVRLDRVQLGWLLLPEEQVAEVWRCGHDAPERLENSTWLDATELFPGLGLELVEIWGV